MKGSEAQLINFMEGADKRYVIPVYQRKYDWKLENCRQLYNDLKKVIINNRDSHFFGSIVSNVIANGNKIEYHIIDGQQRLTTVTLLLLAIQNLIKEGKLKSNEGKLDEQIKQRFLISPWAQEDDLIKLKPIEKDKKALNKLFFDDPEDYDPASNITLNYRFFYNELQKGEFSVDDLFNAISKLEIISITLDEDDNAQLIFESLNSTGLALTEGDKIRNYILMGQEPENQNFLYKNYWTSIEKLTNNDVSGFIRDYLSIKQQVIPNINKVYPAFKSYSENSNFTIKELLEDIKRYARLYNKLITSKSGLNIKELDDCLYRLNQLEINVTRPFLLEVLKLNQDKKISNEDVLQIFLLTENYLFRRNICSIPTNALNKVFLNLNKEIIRYDNNTEDYLEKFKYSIITKKDSSRLPNDDEFLEALSYKQIYQMRGKYKNYLFERFENFGTIETKDVYKHLENNTYSIEHIMPQHLTPAWAKELGENSEKIHEEWLHRLANLTLTGYNPNLSNKTFLEKRDSKGGYKSSGLRMNQKIATKESWGLKELEERNKEMLKKAKKIWAYPKTNFVPKERESDSCSLDDENYELTGRKISKYNYQNIEQPVKNWADMFEHIIKFLHQNDNSILANLAYDENSELFNYIKADDSKLRSPLKIDDHIFIEMNTSTDMKMSILRRLFSIFNLDPMDLIFVLKDSKQKKAEGEERYQLRKEYWEYALPIIQEKNKLTGAFNQIKPFQWSTISGRFGIGGIQTRVITLFNSIRVEFVIEIKDKKRHEEIYKKLEQNKEKLGKILGPNVIWEKADKTNVSRIYVTLDDLDFANKENWEKMALFQANWSRKLIENLLPLVLQEENKLFNWIGIIRSWAFNNKKIILDINKCNKMYTRFTTDTLTKILPNIQNPSSWKTNNCYFYELIISNNKLFLQLSIGKNGLTSKHIKTVEKISELSSKKLNKNWTYYTPFSTEPLKLDESTTNEEILNYLDKSFHDLEDFEEKLLLNLT